MTNEKSSGKVFREIYASVVFIWKLLRVTAAIGKKCCKALGSSVTSQLCQAEELWGTGSLARGAGLVACVASPHWHWCLLMLQSNCTKKSCKTFHPATEVIKHSSSSSGCNAIRELWRWNAIFSGPAHPNAPILFPWGCLAARSFGLQFLQRIGGYRAERWTGQWTGFSQPVRVLAALSFLGAVQDHDFPPAHNKAEIISFSFWQ